MSATPKAPVWTGYFSKSGSPALKIKISGPFGQGVEFEGILDTGFTGFISMPLLSALPLGLILYGTASVELADGTKSFKLTARGLASIEGDSELGVVILEPSSNDILVGMAFLRLFKRTLFVSQELVFLLDESQVPNPTDTQESDDAPEGVELVPLPAETPEDPAATQS